ncbi:hypothetical protein Q8A67_006110 [Cirrhinus molitorella]|uniref:Ig-like domain-containing protein n=1 Tax=Cirrhinus molitorella TaxID=172907 RepID=A0AA88Q5L4_9TELE|nr:hypothetical protein Q8A67_006110 [Cirrhinus molitorella]
MIISSWCFICAFAVLIDKVCLEVTGVIGGSVVLPCSAKHDCKPQDIYVHWRDKNGKIVHDVIKGSQTRTQNSPYKNRAESFPAEYLKGNFSIKLINLTHSDAGKYICHIIHSSELQIVELIIKVSLQDTVEAVIGGSVILPCSTAEHDLKLQNINVHWRQNGSTNVHDITKEQAIAAQDQHQRFKNRTEAFPEEYVRGNYSIKLNNLTHADAGKYNCHITPSNEQETVELIIKESRSKSDTVGTSLLWVCTVLLTGASCTYYL